MVPIPTLPAVLFGLTLPWAWVLICRYAPSAAGGKGTAAGAACVFSLVNPVIDRLVRLGGDGERLHGFCSGRISPDGRRTGTSMRTSSCSCGWPWQRPRRSVRSGRSCAAGRHERTRTGSGNKTLCAQGAPRNYAKA
ncbi:MAG: hypothetical protein ACLT5P_12505 [Flavonifractor plautii]